MVWESRACGYGGLDYDIVDIVSPDYRGTYGVALLILLHTYPHCHNTCRALFIDTHTVLKARRRYASHTHVTNKACVPERVSQRQEQPHPRFPNRQYSLVCPAHPFQESRHAAVAQSPTLSQVSAAANQRQCLCLARIRSSATPARALPVPYQFLPYRYCMRNTTVTTLSLFSLPFSLSLPLIFILFDLPSSIPIHNSYSSSFIHSILFFFSPLK